MASDAHRGGVIGITGLDDDGGVLATTWDIGRRIDVVSDGGGFTWGEGGAVSRKTQPVTEDGVRVAGGKSGV